MQAIQSFGDIEQMLATGARVLVLYSGGLDGSYCLSRLSRRYADKLTALSIDLGGDPISAAAREVCRALSVELVLVDKRVEFVTDFIEPAIHAHACYLGGHPISASLSRPLMARVAVAIAEQKCDVIVHTADPSQNSLRRFNGALSNLGFDGNFGSPYARESISRDEKKKSLAEQGIIGFDDRLFSLDSNLWSREFEAGPLDDP